MDRLLKPEEIAEILGVKVSTIYQWTHQGYIPHIKMRNLVRFREREVEIWLAKLANGGRPSRKVDVRELMEPPVVFSGLSVHK